jgi:hypothetical protein
MSNTPLRCPFTVCSRIRKVVARESYVGGPELDGWQVCCDHCGSCGPVRKSEQEAIDAWNHTLVREYRS